MKAYCLVRPQPHYRLDAFDSGLRAAGYAVTHTPPARGDQRDNVLVIWNRYGSGEAWADGFEQDGGTVLVAENGYIGRDAAGRQHYAIARHGHNGSGQWPQGGPERWAQLGIPLAPMRTDGRHVLVCPNRPFGMRGFEMPVRWAEDTVNAIRAHTRRPVRVRPHPGNWQANPPAVPLADDLRDCWAVVIWASSAGVHALVAGIPVYVTAPHWICRGAACTDLSLIDSPVVHDRRQQAFERLAWAQWTVEEIASGGAFRALLRDPGQVEGAAAA